MRLAGSGSCSWQREASSLLLPGFGVSSGHWGLPGQAPPRCFGASKDAAGLLEVPKWLRVPGGLPVAGGGKRGALGCAWEGRGGQWGFP